MTYRALVVADDLTGAMDSGGEFATRGFDTVVALGGDESDGSETKRNETDGIGNEGIAGDVLVVDTDSRSADPATAARAVTEAIDAHPARVIYEKVDSTLRGNLIPEIDAAIAASNADLAVVAPAFPATGRTTVAGTHRVNGVPATETFDDGTPGIPETAHLPTLLAGSSYPVVTCSMRWVKRGVEGVRERLSGIDEPTIVACDATNDDHLDAIARAAGEGSERVLHVGSAGLARHVQLSGNGPADQSPTEDPTTRDERTRPRTVLGIAGSANPRTIEGVAALPDQTVIALDVERAIVDPGAAIADASERATAALTAGGTAVVTSVPDRAAIERARAAGAAAGAKAAVGERIERALAAVAREVYAERRPDGLFITGGAVARRVLGELGAVGVRLTGETVERGVPIGRLVGGRAGGTRVVTKAGGFGDDRTIANCLARLEGTNE